MVPVYFVLGNHDFWNAPEAVVRAMASTFPGYLDRGEIIELTPRVALVGRSGWYDTLSGNPGSSRVEPQDWKRIERFVDVWRVPHLLQLQCRRWSEEETEKAIPVLEEAARGHQEVFLVTHFPCFSAACFAPDGLLDVPDSGWWPWSINTTFGHAIREVTDNHPHVEFTVLTGHTHGGGKVQLTPNLTCVAGRAHYGDPQLAAQWCF
jgi:predicted MPP superfamily phosphohydrolase